MKLSCTLPLLLFFLLILVVPSLAKEEPRPKLVVQAGHSRAIICAAISGNGSIIATGSADTTIKLWDAHSGKEIRTLPGKTSDVQVNTLDLNHDGTVLASASWDRTIKVWDTRSGISASHIGPTNYITESLDISPDGRWIVAANGKTIHLWDIKSGNLIWTGNHNEAIKSVAFSVNGKWVASGSTDKTIKIWSAKSGDIVKTWQSPSSGILSLVFLPDGKRLLAGDYDKSARIWDVETQQCLATLEGHSYWVKSVAADPKSNVIATGSLEYAPSQSSN